MNTRTKTLLTLAILFSVSLVVSNIIAGKLITLGGVILPAAVFLFPIVYIIGDVIPEVFGLETARKIILLGFFGNLLAVGFFILTIYLPYPPFWEGQEAFKTVLGLTPRLALASFIGYLLGTNANALVLTLIKKITGEKWLWVRTIGSTLVGEYLDSLLFIGIAFFGIMPTGDLWGLILAQGTFKVAYEILATPLTYVVVNNIKKAVKANNS